MLTTMLSGCSTFNSLDSLNIFSASKSDAKTRLCARDNGEFHQCNDMPIENNKIDKDPSLFSTDLNFQLLGEYTEQMAADLQRDLKNTMIDGPIVVASFVNLDSTLQTTNNLGIQLAESFLNDLQQMGLPVSDHKLTGMLKVNAQGDFVFSRDASQIWDDMEIGYVLSGTMLKNNRGVLISARLMNIKTKGVLASTSKLIPNMLLEGMM
jgi:TolB-like protein